MNELLMAEAVLGRDASEFLATDMGRYLIGRAEQEERDAMEQLARVSSWRRKRIQELQAQAWRARSFQAWLTELISAGEAAEAALDEQEHQ